MPLHKRRDFADLQSRARAALETPADLSPADREALVADLGDEEIARSYFDAHTSEFLQSDRVAIEATEAAIPADDPV